jgi:hypothetical protein
MSTAEVLSDVVNLTFRDWEGARRAHLDGVPKSSTVGQVVAEAARALELPLQSFHHALFRGRELPHDETLEELGIHTDDELELVPEVSAGRRG